MLGYSALGAWMASITGHVGELVARIAQAVADYGVYINGTAANARYMNLTAYGWFSSESENLGFIYFWNEKIAWWIEWIKNNNVQQWGNFEAFLNAILQPLVDAELL